MSDGSDRAISFRAEVVWIEWVAGKERSILLDRLLGRGDGKGLNGDSRDSGGIRLGGFGYDVVQTPLLPCHSNSAAFCTGAIQSSGHRPGRWQPTLFSTNRSNSSPVVKYCSEITSIFSKRFPADHADSYTSILRSIRKKYRREIAGCPIHRVFAACDEWVFAKANLLPLPHPTPAHSSRWCSDEWGT